MQMNAGMFDLTDRIAVVVGGSRGLGKAIAQGLAEAGADIVIASRKLDACKRAADEIATATGRRTQPIGVHIGHWEELDPFADACVAAMGRIDILVNCAGMSPTYPDLTSVSETLWDKVQAVNVKGPFRLTATVAGRMASSGGGSIINISAVGSVQPDPDALPYVAAKAALNALTVGFSRAYAPKVRVNGILPGMFATEMAHSWSMEAIERRSKAITLGRLGNASEIVGAAIYLASDASSYTTGTMLNVDGGFTLLPKSLAGD